MTDTDSTISSVDQQLINKYNTGAFQDQPDQESIQDTISNLRTSDAYLKQLDDRTVPIDVNKIYPYHTMNGDVIYPKTSHYENVLRGVYDESLLSQLYFSHQNIENLDKQLRYQVFLLSNHQYTLGPQNRTELIIIMRSIYLNYAQHIGKTKTSITEQIRRLNNIVIEQTAPRLLSNTTQYLYYLRDANEIHKVVLPLPVNVSNKGTKLLRTATGLGF